MSQIVPSSTQNISQRDTTFLQTLQEVLKTSIKSKPYTAYITRSTPSVFLFLIDQSGSMSEKVSLANGTQTTKAEFLSNALNTTLNSLLDRCIKGNEIRDYFEVAVIGYGGKEGDKANMAWEGSLASKTWVKMTELANNFVSEKEEEVVRSIRGNNIVSKIKRKTWIQALAKHRTPMHHAFGMAADLLEDWLVRYKGLNVYPPTIINITDGHFTDAQNSDMLKAANRLKNLKIVFVQCDTKFTKNNPC